MRSLLSSYVLFIGVSFGTLLLLAIPVLFTLACVLHWGLIGIFLGLATVIEYIILNACIFKLLTEENIEWQ